MIHANPLLPSKLENGDISWVHSSEINVIVNTYQQPKHYHKNTSFKKEVFLLLRPELAVLSH